MVTKILWGIALVFVVLLMLASFVLQLFVWYMQPYVQQAKRNIKLCSAGVEEFCYR